MALLKFTVRNQLLSGGGARIISDSIDYVDALFDFRTEDWNGLSKWAHFSKDGEIFDVNLVDDKIEKSAHVNLSEGEWEIKLHGTDPEGTMRITTNTVYFYVESYGNSEEGSPLPEIPLSAAEQIDAKAQEALMTALEALDKAENGGSGSSGEDGFSPVIEISKIEGGHRVSVTDKNGTQTFDVMDGANGEDGKDGADGADGEGGDFVEPLAGDSSEITPAEVAEAIEAGRPVYITYTDGTYGVLAFTNFARAVSLNTVFSSFVIEYGGKTLGAFLGGTPGYSQWQFDVMELAKAGEGGEANSLVGSTAEITPEQVAAAVEAGRTVYITHTDATYGTVGFSDFAKMQQGILGNLVFVQEDFVISAGLLGNLNDGTWTLNVSSLLTDSGEVLPEVSTDDNGKFLRVENGIWVAAVVPSAEEASF